MLFGSRSMGFINGMQTSMVRSLISKHSAQSDQGSVFAAIAVLEAVASFAGVLLTVDRPRTHVLPQGRS